MLRNNHEGLAMGMRAKQSMLILMGLMASLTMGPVWAQQAPDAVNPTIQMDSASQQVPQGRLVKIAFLTALDAGTSHTGDAFSAQLSEDLTESGKLILPKGTLIRGRVEEVQSPKLFGKGAMMRLGFDHVVMPSGELEPMTLQLTATKDKVTQNHVLYTDPGLSAKLDASWDKGVSKFREMRDKGINAGKQMGGGANMLLTVPTTAVAGAVAGTAVTTYNAAKAVFGHGEDVMIQPGEQMSVDFAQAIQLPSQ